MVRLSTRELVRARAAYRCEYCQLHEDDDVYVFHVEHVIATKHGGGESKDNLALACHQCNLHKGPNLSGLDPISGEMTALFHPRRQRWGEHFRRAGARIEGITAVGRTTVFVLCMNDADRVETRRLLDT